MGKRTNTATLGQLFFVCTKHFDERAGDKGLLPVLASTHLGFHVHGGGPLALRSVAVVTVVGEPVAKGLVVGPLLAQRQVEHREGRVSGDELRAGEGRSL